MDNSDLPDVTFANVQALEQQVKTLQRELVRANSELDDKIAKLQAAGQNTVSSSKQLAAASARLEKLEARLHSNGTASQITSELSRSRELVSTLESQLAAARQQLKALAAKRSASDSNVVDRELARLQSQLREAKDALRLANIRERDFADDRDDILKGVTGLQDDLLRVRTDAVELGSDIARIRRHNPG